MAYFDFLLKTVHEKDGADSPKHTNFIFGKKKQKKERKKTPPIHKEIYTKRKFTKEGTKISSPQTPS